MALDSLIKGEYFIPVLIFIGSIFFSIFLHFILRAGVRKARSDVGERILKGTVKLIYALILSIGLYFALKSSPIFSSYSSIFNTAFPVALVFIFALLVGQLLYLLDPHYNKDKEEGN